MSKEDLQKQFMELLAAGKVQPSTVVLGDNIEKQINIDKIEKDAIQINISSSAATNESQSQPSSVSPESNSGSSSPAPDVRTEKKLFPRITKAAYDAGKAEKVDDDLRSASVSAPKLIKALNLNEALGYVDIKNINSKDLYDLLDDCYELKFGPRCFRNYRSK